VEGCFFCWDEERKGLRAYSLHSICTWDLEIWKSEAPAHVQDRQKRAERIATEFRRRLQSGGDQGNIIVGLARKYSLKPPTVRRYLAEQNIPLERGPNRGGPTPNIAHITRCVRIYEAALKEGWSSTDAFKIVAKAVGKRADTIRSTLRRAKVRFGPIEQTRGWMW